MFVSVFQLWEDFIFGYATYQLNKQRQTNLGKPSALSKEKDIKSLRDHVVKRMKALVADNVLGQARLCELKDCAC